MADLETILSSGDLVNVKAKTAPIDGFDLTNKTYSDSEDAKTLVAAKAHTDDVVKYPATLYKYNSVRSLTDLPDTFTDLNSCEALSVTDGVYELGLSIWWDFDRTAHSVILEATTDGGTTWHSFTFTPIAKTDTNMTSHIWPLQKSTGENIILKTRIKKESGGGALNVSHSNVWIKHVQ